MEEKYVSVYLWKDLQDNGYIYKKGDIYPREGLEVSKKRIKELSSTKNKIGKVLIEKVEINSEEDTEETNEDKIVEEGKVVIDEKAIIPEEDAKKLDETEVKEVVAEKVEINSEESKDETTENE